jgi:hypothetical protein
VAHEPRDPLKIDPLAVGIGEFGLDPRRSVRAVGHLVDRLDASDQRGIVGRSPRGRLSFPRFRGRFDYAASAILAALSNSPGLM